MSDPRGTALRGLAYGLAAVLAWAIYNIGVAQGRAAGFSVADLTLLRYLGATLALAPVVIRRRGAGRLVPGRILALLCLAGPHFGVLYNLGMPLTKLGHAVVISPGLSMLVALGLSAGAAGQPPGLSRLTGIALLLAALALIALDRSGAAGPDRAWRGDLIFVLTGTLYGSFTFLLGRWRSDAIMVTFWIAALSLALVGLWYLVFATPTAHAVRDWAGQLVIQGVLGGGWAIVLYALSIRDLGAGRAAIFPALVPVATAILGLPLTGIAPSVLEALGALVAAAGMYLALRQGRRR